MKFESEEIEEFLGHTAPEFLLKWAVIIMRLAIHPFVIPIWFFVVCFVIGNASLPLAILLSVIAGIGGWHLWNNGSISIVNDTETGVTIHFSEDDDYFEHIVDEGEE